MEEVNENCQKPLEEELAKFEIGGYKPFSPETSSGLDAVAKTYYLGFFLQEKLQEKIGRNDVKIKFEVGNEPREESWWCIGFLASTKEFSADNTQEFQEFQNQWGNWNLPIILFYWSSNGLVVYEYEPKNTPAP